MDILAERISHHSADLAQEACEMSRTNLETFARVLGDWLQPTIDRCRAYHEIGIDKSLADVDFSRMTDNLGQEVYSIVLRAKGSRLATRFNDYSFEGAFKKLKETEFMQKLIAGDKEEKKTKQKISDFTVVSLRPRPEGYVAVKRGKEWVTIAKYDTVEAAREAYRDLNNHEQWEHAYQAWVDENNLATRSRNEGYRSGLDWRANGKNVTPEQFMETFGFRGVEFGNYVEGPRRQADLNNTYDALMDLSYALDTAPQTLSLNRSLGLAFGARGIGGIRAASAHYEPDYRVINLTKSQGAGSLAHEIFHAIDHFLADELRQRSKNTTLSPAAGATFLTDMSNQSYFRRFIQDESNQDIQDTLVRLRDSVEQLNKSPVAERSRDKDRTRSGKPYWGTVIEIGARTFESAVKTTLKGKGIENSYLVDVIDSESKGQEGISSGSIDVRILRNDGKGGSTFPYPFVSEMEPMRELMTQITSAMLELSPIFKERFDLEHHLGDVESNNVSDDFALEPALYQAQQSLF